MATVLDRIQTESGAEIRCPGVQGGTVGHSGGVRRAWTGQSGGKGFACKMIHIRETRPNTAPRYCKDSSTIRRKCVIQKC